MHTEPERNEFHRQAAGPESAESPAEAKGGNGGGGSESPTNALERRIAELEAQVKEKEAKYVYLYAEFENFKKRAIRERQDQIKYGWDTLARDLLQVVDNLERALQHMPAGADKSMIDGIQMVLHQFKSVMAQQGVRAMEPSFKPFDPNLQEAVGQEPSEHPEGTVIHEHLKGYMLHDRLLRPARVVLSSGKKVEGTG